MVENISTSAIVINNVLKYEIPLLFVTILWRDLKLYVLELTKILADRGVKDLQS